jgi:aminobutyraldehyde dehydrogenase
MAPALAAGNTVVLKPSEQTPLTTLKLATICAELFPSGVVNIVCGRGNTVGAPLVAQPEVAMISLTGSVASGEKVLSAAVSGTKRTHLELGGKAPVIVFDDADLESVVGGVRTFGFYNAGQDCTAACRIYAGPKIYDKLVADLSSAASSIKMGTQEEGRGDGPIALQTTSGFRIRPARGEAAHRSHRGWQVEGGQRIFFEPP